MVEKPRLDPLNWRHFQNPAFDGVRQGLRNLTLKRRVGKCATMSSLNKKLQFFNALPAGATSDRVLARPEEALVIFDRKLKQLSPEFRKWVTRFPNRYEVQSGEALKRLEDFPKHALKLAQIAKDISPRSLTIIAIGGGSIGDFAGFFASVFKRGVGLVHVPTTWLSAIDSSHGGKTGLNLGTVKNQVGTFYPARRTTLIRSLLELQPQARLEEAMGELAKIAIIDGGAWTKRLTAPTSEVFWSALPSAIEAKMKVVKRDPFEIKGHRQILNLGHTIGHVLEGAHGWAHGRAVARGLYFTLDYSFQAGAITQPDYDRLEIFIRDRCGLKRENPQPLKSEVFVELLSADKKRAGKNTVTFIFIKKFGRVQRQAVVLRDLLNEARRQRMVR